MEGLTSGWVTAIATAVIAAISLVTYINWGKVKGFILKLLCIPAKLKILREDRLVNQYEKGRDLSDQRTNERYEAEQKKVIAENVQRSELCRNGRSGDVIQTPPTVKGPAAQMIDHAVKFNSYDGKFGELETRVLELEGKNLFCTRMLALLVSKSNITTDQLEKFADPMTFAYPITGIEKEINDIFSPNSDRQKSTYDYVKEIRRERLEGQGKSQAEIDDE